MPDSTFDRDADAVDDEAIRRAVRRSVFVLAMLIPLLGLVAYWLNQPPKPAAVTVTPLAAPEMRERPDQPVPGVVFRDATDTAGLHFVHCNGAYGDKLLPETMGGGCAVFDYNNDGHQDLLLVNSCSWPGRQPDGQPPPTMALYENEGAGHFRDVTHEAGLALTLFGMGAAVGDYDNDGWRDVFISAVGENRLLQNRQGKFVDVTHEAGVAGEPAAWSTACGWFDYDRDGRLDLFVANYVAWSPEIDLSLDRTLDGAQRAYLPPTSFAGTFPYLYRNEGGGRFRDVSAAAGIQIRNPATGVPIAKSLGLALVDLDRDGWLDVVVANDTVQNFVLHNQRDGTFQEIGALAGVAFDSNGQARGAMGIDAGRFRNNGDLGLVIGNFANEMNALYVSSGDVLGFTDEAIATGLGPATRLVLTFGTFFFDYDLDGRLDLLAANGHLENEIEKLQASQRYEQSPQLFWNAGPDEPTEFCTVPAEKTGPEFARPLVGRGCAYGDLDGDGDLDVLITCVGSRPRLLRNDQQLGHHWLRFRLTGTRVNRDAIGARIEVHLGDRVLSRDISATRSYLSQCELVATFGLGAATHVDRVLVHWPDGSQQEVACPELDRLYEVTQAAMPVPSAERDGHAGAASAFAFRQGAPSPPARVREGRTR